MSFELNWRKDRDIYELLNFVVITNNSITFYFTEWTLVAAVKLSSIGLVPAGRIHVGSSRLCYFSFTNSLHFVIIIKSISSLLLIILPDFVPNVPWCFYQTLPYPSIHSWRFILTSLSRILIFCQLSAACSYVLIVLWNCKFHGNPISIGVF